MTVFKLWRDRVSPVGIGLLLATVVYIGVLLLSPWLPGDPIWAIQPETIQSLLNESLNFFFILPLVNRVGVTVMLAPPVYPMIQALFNFVEAWIFMFLPLLLLDPRGQRMPSILIWGLAMFLTNVFLLPYMTIRLFQPAVDHAPETGHQKGVLAKAFGGVGLLVGSMAIFWGLGAQPEVGGLTQRWAYFLEQVLSDRATLAFCVDLVLFYSFQIWLMGAIIAKGERSRSLRFIPLWGLAIWLLI